MTIKVTGIIQLPTQLGKLALQLLTYQQLSTPGILIQPL